MKTLTFIYRFTVPSLLAFLLFAGFMSIGFSDATLHFFLKLGHPNIVAYSFFFMQLCFSLGGLFLTAKYANSFIKGITTPRLKVV